MFDDWSGYGMTTAISRPGASLPLRELLKDQKLDRSTRILDYGAGRGADVAWLQRKGYQVDAYDPAHEVDAPGPHGKYGLVLMVYVLNVIPTPAQRREAIRRAFNYASSCGELFVVTRTQAEVDREAHARGWKRQGDGWATPAGTFQRGYDWEELCDLVGRVTGAECMWRFSDSRFAAVVARRSSSCALNGLGGLEDLGEGGCWRVTLEDDGMLYELLEVAGTLLYRHEGGSATRGVFELVEAVYGRLESIEVLEVRELVDGRLSYDTVICR